MDIKTKVAKDSNKEKENIFIVELPYKIGTKLQTYENGRWQNDYVYQYIISSDTINVILMLCYDKDPRLSIPIPLDNLKKRWKPLEKKTRRRTSWKL